MQFLLRSFLHSKKVCCARGCCEKEVTYKVWLTKDDWNIFVGTLCEEHAEAFGELLPTKIETLSKVSYT